MAPLSNSKAHVPCRPPDERDATGDYVFPERIALDDASFEAFSADVSDAREQNVREQNAALRAFFESFRKK